jgi:hypothetical protein
MGTSPISPDDIRAAAGAHHELGPDYGDAVVASFLARVDHEIAVRVAERLGTATPQPRPVEPAGRHLVLKGFALGVASSIATVLLVEGARPGHHALVLLAALLMAIVVGAARWIPRYREYRRAALQQGPPAAAGDYRRIS